MSTSTTTFSHASIGDIKSSTTKPDVLQFLGLQYATLTDRFAPAVMKSYAKNATTDASRLGPQVLSIAPGPDGEQRLIQHALEYDRSALSMSDTKGLSLNITAPASGQGGSVVKYGGKLLPVFVFVHGGGFNVGSGVYPQYDMARFVRASVGEGMPCLGVAMNYRLSAPGLLTSHALCTAGYKPNNTLRDQRTALLWLKKFISGFGGDPANITLAGESAGGVSVCYHLFSKEPLFKRMVSMSGTNLLTPPISPEVADENYVQAVNVLGLEGLGEREQVERLVEMEGKDLVLKLTQSGMPCIPVLDDDLVPTTFDFASMMSGETVIPGRQWCEAAIIGDCQFDGMIQGLRLMGRKKGIASAFCSTISKGVLADTPEVANKLLSAYSLHPDLDDDDEAFFKVLQVANDINWYICTLAFAEAMDGEIKTYMYRFNEPNPWEGPWKGYATHILDVAFLLQNFNEFLEEEGSRKTAEHFALDFIRFVNGREPWTEWKADKNVAKVFGQEGKMEVVEDVPEKTGRRSIMLELGKEVRFDKLNEAFNAFLKPPPAV